MNITSLIPVSSSLGIPYVNGFSLQKDAVGFNGDCYAAPLCRADQVTSLSRPMKQKVPAYHLSDCSEASLQASHAGGVKAKGAETAPAVVKMNTRYQKGLVQFRERCNDNSVIMKFISSLFDRNFCSLITTLKQAPQINIADIGCGDGKVSLHLLTWLQQVFNGNLHYDIIEPIKSYIDQTRSRLAHSLDEHPNTSMQCHQLSAETYFQQSQRQHYQLIYSSHSLHLIDLASIPDMLDSLALDGFLVIVIGAQESIMSVLKNLFLQKPGITGREIVESVRNYSRDNFEINIEDWPSTVDFSGISLPELYEDLEEDVKNLLSLMAQVNLDEVGQKGYEQVRQNILIRLRDSKLELLNDCIVIRRRK